MSLDATRWAWQQSLRPSHKLVLLSLADRAGTDHTVWPSYTQIVADTGLDRKTIHQAISHLVSLGILKDTGDRKGKTKQIPIFVLIGVTCRSEEKGDRKRNHSENGTIPFFPSNSTENGTIPKTVLLGDLPVNHAVIGETVPKTEPFRKRYTESTNIEPTKEPTKHRFDASAFLIDLGASKQLVLDWLAVRKTKKQPNTETAMKGFIREIGKAGLTIDQALEKCCEKGWAGFMASWLKDEQPKKQSIMRGVI